MQWLKALRFGSKRNMNQYYLNARPKKNKRPKQLAFILALLLLLIVVNISSDKVAEDGTIEIKRESSFESRGEVKQPPKPPSVRQKIQQVDGKKAITQPVKVKEAGPSLELDSLTPINP